MLGWQRWREIDARYFLAMLPATLERAMDEGLVPRQSTEPLARLLAGAVTEAAVACAAAEDPAETGRAYVRARALAERPGRRRRSSLFARSDEHDVLTDGAEDGQLVGSEPLGADDWHKAYGV